MAEAQQFRAEPASTAASIDDVEVIATEAFNNHRRPPSWKVCSRVDAFHWFQKLRCETIESRLVIGVGLPKRVKRDGHAVIRVPAVRIRLEDQSAEGGQSTR